MTENQIDSIELRSEEVQEILTRIPHWMIRWGSVVIFFIILLLFSLSFVIKYPDIVTANIIITTNTPPEKLVAKTSGKIVAILVTNKSIISANTAIAIIENTANYKDVFLLKSLIDNYDIEKNSFPFDKIPALQLGDIEAAFAVISVLLLRFPLFFHAILNC